MTYKELIVLVPCHGWEDFPIHFDGDQAAGLLAAYTGLWHPALIQCAGVMPRWTQADDPSHDLAAPLVLVPEIARGETPEDRLRQLRETGAVLDEQATREEFVSAALARIESSATFDPEFVADLFALGLAHLLTELLTVQMRYTSMIDEELFTRRLVEAVEAGSRANLEEARQSLQACFDLLSAARDHFYPVDNYIIDLTLLAPSSIGPWLRQRVTDETPQNFLCGGALLDQIGQQDPALLTALRKAVEADRATVVGGEWEELENGMLPPETLLRNFRQGIEAHGTHLGRNPRVYGRRRHGLLSVLPQLLMRNGFAGAMHFTLDEGKFPVSEQSKVQWEGLDHSGLECFARLPLDAAKNGNLLAYSRHMGDSMDMDHIAAICYAHWPNTETPWYTDLRRAARYTTSLGRFITLDDYFLQTDMSGMMSSWSADRYQSPYLSQDIARSRPDPISRHVRLIRRRALWDDTRSLIAMLQLIRGQLSFAEQVEDLEIRLDAVAGKRGEDSDAWEAAVAKLREQVAADFAGLLPCESGPEQCGVLTLNALDKPRTVVIPDTCFDGAVPVADATKQVVAHEAAHAAIVEVPPLGYAWTAADTGQAWPATKRKSKPLAEPNLLRNEFFELKLDEQTGGIRSVFDFKTRGNRLSQQLAIRSDSHGPIPRGFGGESESSSVMVADSSEILSAGPVEGAIAVAGRLVDQNGETLAKFKQTITLPRVEPIIKIAIEFDPVQMPVGDPWSNYYCQRLAWSDPNGIVNRGLMMTAEPTGALRIESPYFVDIDEPLKRVTLLCGGLPYHRRRGENQLETLLLVAGETERHFELAIALDQTPAAGPALAYMVPPLQVESTAATVRPPSSWFFHIDSKSLVATHWSTLREGEQYSASRIEESPEYTPRPTAEPDAPVIGFRARLLETSGRAGTAELRCFRELDAAQRVDFRGEGQYELRTNGDTIALEYGPHDWVEMIALWKT